MSGPSVAGDPDLGAGVGVSRDPPRARRPSPFRGTRSLGPGRRGQLRGGLRPARVVRDGCDSPASRWPPKPGGGRRPAGTRRQDPVGAPAPSRSQSETTSSRRMGCSAARGWAARAGAEESLASGDQDAGGHSGASASRCEIGPGARGHGTATVGIIPSQRPGRGGIEGGIDQVREGGVRLEGLVTMGKARDRRGSPLASSAAISTRTCCPYVGESGLTSTRTSRALSTDAPDELRLLMLTHLVVHPTDSPDPRIRWHMTPGSTSKPDPQATKDLVGRPPE